MLVLNAHSTLVSFSITSRTKVNKLKTKTSNVLLKFKIQGNIHQVSHFMKAMLLIPTVV